MANQEHLKILESGIEKWNAWRNNNSDVTPDLSGADLPQKDLRGAVFDNTNLQNVNLTMADLSGAILTNSNLNNAQLGGANLSKANLTGAQLLSTKLNNSNLYEANLENVKASGAKLSEASCRNANFRRAELANSYMRGIYLGEVNLSEANLCGANLLGATLVRSNLSQADLISVDLTIADIRWATLVDSNLSNANLSKANLSDAILTNAVMVDANLSEAIFVRADLRGSDIRGCFIYGVSTWDLKLDDTTTQIDLMITRGPLSYKASQIYREGGPAVVNHLKRIAETSYPEFLKQELLITVDDIEVAGFIHLLIANKKIRNVIDVISKKAVLILGRFTNERVSILHAIREEIRKHDYLPILFDFEKPKSKNLTETVSTLAHMARFIIADITDARSIPQELQRIVPQLPSVPVLPLLEASSEAYGMFWDFMDYRTVLPVESYHSVDELLGAIADKVIAPVEDKIKEIEKRKRLVEKEMLKLKN